jgi:hypothetical protein
MKACPEKRKAITEETEVVAKHQEVPNEQTAVETIGALEVRYGEWHLAREWRRQPKKRAQADSGSRKRLTNARGLLTRRAVPALSKGYGRR